MRFVTASLRQRSLAVLTAAAIAAVPAFSAGAGQALAEGDCPALFVLGVQGTGQSSPDADPTSDTGMLGQVLSPLKSAAGDLVERRYVPYEAGFGGAVPGGQAPYTKSVKGAIDKLTSQAQSIASRCGDTKLAFVGYSQGAHAVSQLAKAIGGGGAGISPDKVAAVATFGDPERPEGAPTFPGDAGRVSPAPVPGAQGESVTSLAVADPSGPKGGGIAPRRSTAIDYGRLTGRVASFCEGGDLACDAPVNAPIVHVVTNVAAQSKLNPDDPTAALVSLAEQVGLMTLRAAPKIINEDVQVGDDGSIRGLSYEPRQTVSQRLEAASDPGAPMPGVDESIRAVLKVGMVAFNSAVRVLTNVFTIDTIAMLATVGLANPEAALALLAKKTAAAVLDLVPPATIGRWFDNGIDLLKREIVTNAEMINVSSLLSYFDASRKHGSYASTPKSATGKSATQFVTAWLAKAAGDIAGKPVNVEYGTTPGTTDSASILGGTSGDSSSSSNSDGTSAASLENALPNSWSIPGLHDSTTLPSTTATPGAPTTTTPEPTQPGLGSPTTTPTR